MNKPVIIGLTGPTGAGKSTVAADLSQQGCSVIDCDFIARKVVDSNQQCIVQLQNTFGNDIVDEHRSLNRRLLAQRAFSSKQKSKELNKITHPFIITRIEAQIAELQKNGAAVIVVDAPLLFEIGADLLCNVIVTVTAPLNVRLSRIMLRDNISEQQAVARINVQQSDDFYTKRADYCINGANTLEQIAVTVKTILNQIAGGLHEKS